MSQSLPEPATLAQADPAHASEPSSGAFEALEHTLEAGQMATFFVTRTPGGLEIVLHSESLWNQTLKTTGQVMDQTFGGFLHGLKEGMRRSSLLDQLRGPAQTPTPAAATAKASKTELAQAQKVQSAQAMSTPEADAPPDFTAPVEAQKTAQSELYDDLL